jgi:hypothetical protein
LPAKEKEFLTFFWEKESKTKKTITSGLWRLEPPKGGQRRMYDDIRAGLRETQARFEELRGYL